ncbi:hypothetical protein PybrP1_000783 [[Pythium] brassicae (nom. inval.)]|nr:hypothetical protein PybrP1_000783 [[Pythium] brassicae (nom. inval.)]
MMTAKVELVLFSALFLAPAAAIWVLALHTGSLLSLHAALNALALLVCTPSGLWLVLQRKRESDYATRVRLTQWHLAVNVAALVVLSVAGTVAFAAKRAAGERHLASRHSWGGLAVALFLALNVFQGVLLTYEGKRANWQWKDETHGLVGSLVYIGSAATLVYGVQSDGWAAGFDPEWRQRLAILIGVAHAAMLGKLALSSKAAASTKSE